MTAPAFGGQLRSVDLSFTPAEEAFRSELRAWLRDHVPRSMPATSLANEVEALRGWQRTLSGGGWVGIQWPRAYGGRLDSVRRGGNCRDGRVRRDPSGTCGTQLPRRSRALGRVSGPALGATWDRE
ncbi:MAG: hypothetical protein E6J56_20480 [Deltaproteobacteria bacterium]|nr:MAG: hypothetical protein E6J56_20480 [Deltaproteobacteria bacterium]